VAYCYNCKTEIPDGDKTRLCDQCKTIILPFVKFMDASTSSAVRRLISNERNLRNIGVTDGGMEYLLRLCELHDKKKLSERDLKKTIAPEPIENVPKVEETAQATPECSEDKLPVDEPIILNRTAYGKNLSVCAILLLLVGVGLIISAVVGYVMSEPLEVDAIIGSVGFFVAAHVVNVLRKTTADLDEIKKSFK